MNEVIGKTISHYKILEKLGEGGMGVVYRAEDAKLGRSVALKFLAPELTRDGEAKRRFVQEARAASALDHPNICNIHEIDETNEGRMFIAMACYEGESLKSKIEHGPLKLDEALDIALQIARGLATAHERNIIHRDIKPANVLITKGGLVKIVDFGLAKLAGTKVTKTGTTLGTARYMSPEQARGEEVDARSDIFSLGAVLYEMLTGKHAFTGEYDQAALYAILNHEPEPVTALRSGIPMELERIVKKALAKKSSERYQHVEDLIVDLQNVARESAATASRAAGQPPARPSQRALRIWLPAAIIIAVSIATLLFIGKSQRGTGQWQKSIAVLPFQNMSSSPDDEYFSDGITEDIIAQLSKITDLKVISRTSIMGYKASTKNIRDIGEELDVAAILEGSVRRAGNHVRIVAQLIDARNEGHLWTETYDEEMTEIFSIQSDVAQKIAAALEATLLPEEKERIEKSPTENLTAYDYYLRGRDYYNRYSREDNENALVLFKKALALDPGYALAYAGLGDAYGQRVDKYGYSSAWLDSAVVMSEKAIAIDPKLAEGYKALGLAHELSGRFDEGLDAYRRALELNPGYGAALANIGWIEMFRGNYAESARLFRKHLAMDPRTAYNYVGLAYVYGMLDDEKKARELLERALELQPNFVPAHLGLIFLSFGEGKYNDAVMQGEQVLGIDPGDFMALNTAGEVQLCLGDLDKASGYYERALAIDSFAANIFTGKSPLLNAAYIQWETGHTNEARDNIQKVLDHDLKELARGSMLFKYRYELACINAMQGDRARAYEWLQQAIDTGWRNYKFASADPLLENLRSDAQFKEIMTHVKQLVDEQRKRFTEAGST